MSEETTEQLRLRVKTVGEKFVHAKKGLENAKMLTSFIAGSTMFNLARDDGISDEDFHGVYQMTTAQALSLHPPTETVTGGGKDDKDANPDHSYHELKKYISLILKGNPTAMEALFVPKEYVVYTTPEFEELRALRHHLITQQLVSSYIGFFTSQIKNLEKDKDWASYENRPVSTKPMYHAFRLMYECKRVIKGDDPIVRFPPGPEHDKIMSIRNGDLPVKDLLEQAKGHLNELLDLRKTSTIPERAPEEPFNELLLRLRKV